ncbi:MAG TPA: nucleotide exchange factor GrpE [Saprospiraceae bacterium]|nr:nucleotide exchange factor GrpE [Saprospiraceae bacterium]
MGKKDVEKPNGAANGKDALESTDEKIFDFDKATGEDTGEEDLSPASQNQLLELQAALQESKDKHLRLLAEFENYKKRTMRERLDLLNGAARDVIMSLLPILDDFDRAKKSADDPTTGEKFSEGVKLVYNRLSAVLQSLGLKEMDSTGEVFDPEWHDAITEIPAPDESLKGKVIDTIEKGYLLHDKIIRHAKVVVGN